MKNKLFVIEGTDGCGKKTQSQLLAKRLREMGENVIVQAYPDYDSPACEPVKMFLRGEFGGVSDVSAYQANALYAVDRYCSMQKHKDHIKNGGSIILDRYTQSSMLYQASKFKDLTERDKFLDYVDNFEFELLKLPRPDMIIFLDVPIEVSLKLMKERKGYKSGNDKDVFEEDTQELINAYESGKYVAEKFGWTVINCVKDGEMLSIEEISDKIMSEILNKENN